MKPLSSRLFLSLFGVGFLPFMPGTFGSFVSILILFFLNTILPEILLLRISILCVLSALLFWISLREIPKQKEKNRMDHSWIVIDECIGIILTTVPLFFVSASVWIWGIAFLFFRFFDIVKPLNIRKWDRRKGALAVLMDDVFAGIYSSILISALLFLLLL